MVDNKSAVTTDPYMVDDSVDMNYDVDSRKDLDANVDLSGGNTIVCGTCEHIIVESPKAKKIRGSAGQIIENSPHAKKPRGNAGCDLIPRTNCAYSGSVG